MIMDLSDEQIRVKEKISEDFYKKNVPILLPQSNWRQYRVRLWNNEWYKIPDRITDSKTLQRWLISLKPRDVYFMTGRFLNPQHVGPKKWKGKPGYKWDYNLFLGGELYFDIDHKNLDEINKIIEDLKKENFKKIVLIKTGNGYHIHVYDFEKHFDYLKGIDNPFEREFKYKRVKTLIAERYSEKYDIDKQITLDTRRILRVPNTMHGNTGKKISVISGEKYLTEK